MVGVNYLSREGFEKLKSEYEELFHIERPRLLEEISAAAAQGDRSENAEYIYGKKRLREIDSRLRHLGRKLENCEIVDNSGRDTDKVFFGAIVELSKQAGGTQTVQIVGADEIDPLEGRISKESPLGKELMGKSKGDSVKVQTPRGILHHTILSIRY